MVGRMNRSDSQKIHATLMILKHRNNLHDIAQTSLFLNLIIFYTFSSVSIINFEQVNVCWVVIKTSLSAWKLWLHFSKLCSHKSDVSRKQKSYLKVASATFLREHLQNKEKCFFFHFESSSRSWDIDFWRFRCSNIMTLSNA